MPTHQIKPGDTGTSVAETYKITLGQLYAANPGVVWTQLEVGRHLHIPSNQTVKYEVKSRDTGIFIAGKVGIPFEVLENLNPGTKWTQLKAGDTLNIPASESLVKESVGSPISGVPAQMPPPTDTQAKPFVDPAFETSRKKVAEFISATEDLKAAFGKVGALNWVSVFALIFKKISPSNPFPVGGTSFAVVDLRNPSNEHDKLAVPWTIPKSLSLPCVEGKANGTAFDNATKDKKYEALFSNFNKLRDVIFVDTHGHFRAPEIATRYAQWLVKNNKGADEPNVYFLSGGLAAYCNAQSFGRILLNSQNAYVTGWPTSL